MTTEMEKNYQVFVKFHYVNQDLIQFDKENNPLQKIHKLIALFWSQNLDKENQHSEYITSNFDITDLNSSINGISKLKNQNQTFFLLYSTNFHFDRLEYKNIIATLKQLKKAIGDESFILIPPNKSPHIKTTFLNEMLKFIFPKNKIRIFNIARVTPKNRDEVKLILEENHSSKLGGHYAFNKTYSKLKKIITGLI